MLLVDDDERVRELVRVNLELEGYAVAEAGSAEDGLAAIEQARPDLVLARRDDAARRRLGDAAADPGAVRHGAIPVVMFSGGERRERGNARAQGFVGSRSTSSS